MQVSNHIIVMVWSILGCAEDSFRNFMTKTALNTLPPPILSAEAPMSNSLGYWDFPWHFKCAERETKLIFLCSLAYNLTQTCLWIKKNWFKGNTIHLYCPIAADGGADSGAL